MNQLAEAVGFGLVDAAVIALAAVGLSLQVSVTNFINFAYGDFMSFGAYVTYAANAAGLNFFPSVAVGAAGTGLLGVISNWVVFRPLMRRKSRTLILLICTVGLSFIVQNAIVMIWGPNAEHYSVTVGNALHLGPFLFTPGDLILIGVAFTLLLALHFFMQNTKFGTALRATSNNDDLAQACGIDTGRVVMWTWALSGMLCAVAGVGLALETNSLRPTTGFNELFVVFGAIILGGIGRVYGAMLGALVIGILTEVSAMFISPVYSGALAFTVVIVVLLLRPQGLLPGRGRSA
ncbi:MAG: branched-chain amino acid ABC transporter permease [Candidatus Dormibacteraeota bacterium]|nr:branched-chain amino acid ABC transporter permease [Candidatus Dormibacteraeota bacterium]